MPIVSHQQCQLQLQQTRLGYDYRLHPGMVCAGGEEGKDACKVSSIRTVSFTYRRAIGSISEYFT